MTGKALILGANGRFGSHVAEAFWDAGWAVQPFRRGQDRLIDAAKEADVIVNGWNPPYTLWEDQLRDQAEHVIAAARASGATVLMPGNVYVYGAQAPAVLSADTAHAAANPLGRLRIEVEDMYRQSGVQVLLLRAGDFIDIRPSGNWFDRIIAKDAARGRFSYPGDPDVPHAWAYLPDLGRAALALVERRSELGMFEEVLFPGFTLSGRQMCAGVAEAMKRPVRLSSMSWLPIQLARPFWPMARHLLEMRYLWSMPHRIKDDRLAGLAPDLDVTSVEAALRSALQYQIDPDKPVARRKVAVTA